MEIIPMIDEKYCTHCGTKLDGDNCPGCGKEIEYHEQILPDYSIGESVYYKDEDHKVEDMKMMLHPGSQLYEDAYKLEGINGYIFWEELFYDNFFTKLKHRINY